MYNKSWAPFWINNLPYTQKIRGVTLVVLCLYSRFIENLLLCSLQLPSSTALSSSHPQVPAKVAAFQATLSPMNAENIQKKLKGVAGIRIMTPLGWIVVLISGGVAVVGGGVWHLEILRPSRKWWAIQRVIRGIHLWFFVGVGAYWLERVRSSCYTMPATRIMI